MATRRRDPNNPSDVFFWKDWENDHGLKASCLAAQGLWMRLLCIAARSKPRGFVLINNNAVDALAVARLASIPESEAEMLLSELERNGVFSRDRRGRIFSRKMVRQESASKKAQENGAKGGNPALLASSEKQRLISGPVNPEVKPQDKPPYPIPHTHTGEEGFSNENPPPPDGGGGASNQDFDRLLEAVGYDPDGHIPRAWAERGAAWMTTWSGRGLSADNIIAAAKGSREYHPTPPDTPQALDKAMDRALATPAKEVPKATPEQMMQFWADRIKGGHPVTPSAINPRMARAMVEAGLVTTEELKQLGIAA